jgi:hypothetical protein
MIFPMSDILVLVKINVSDTQHYNNPPLNTTTNKT